MYNGTNRHYRHGFNSPMFFIIIRGNESKHRLDEKLNTFITKKIGFVNFMQSNKQFWSDFGEILIQPMKSYDNFPFKENISLHDVW